MRARGWLVDVYETVVRVDLRVVGRELALIADVPLDAFGAAVRPFGHRLTLGTVAWSEVFSAVLEECGREPSPILVGELATAHERLLIEHAVMFDDGHDLLVRLRRAGAGTALVSNCAPHTRAMLEHLDLDRLVDHVVLSCETGTAKPDPAIYLDALGRLGVAPADAVLVDDQSRYCAGAVALGMAALQIRREPVAVGSDPGWQRWDDLTDVPVER